MPEGDFDFFFLVDNMGGHPYWGEIGPLWPSRPTGRPLIMGRVDEKKGGVRMKRGRNEVKKVGEKKNLTYRSNKVRTIQTSREKMVKSFSLCLKTKNSQPFRQQPKPKVVGYSEQKKLACRRETDMAAASIFDEGRSRTSER